MKTFKQIVQELKQKPKRDIPYREGCLMKRYIVFKPCFKRIPDKRVRDSVNKYLLEVRANSYRVCIEEIANRYKIKHSQIDLYFRELNRKGILSQARREFAHDTNRNPIFYSDTSGWCPNFYYIYPKTVEELKDALEGI